MDLTAHYIADSRRVTAEIDNADITNPDHPRSTLTVLITRTTETLRTMTDHTERLAEEADTMRSRIAFLEAENGRLRREAAERAAA